MVETSVAETLSGAEVRVLNALLEGPGTPEEVESRGGFDSIVEVMNAASWLSSKGLVTIDESVRTSYVLGTEGERYIAEGLPEMRLLAAMDGRREARIADLFAAPGLDKPTVTIAIGALKGLGSAVERGLLVLPESVEAAVAERQSYLSVVAEGRAEPGPVLEHLLGRKGVVERRERVVRHLRLTEAGAELARSGLEVREEVSQLTSELIQSGRWRNARFRPYDVQAFAPAAPMGRTHPLRDLLEEIAEVFVSMGFQEITGEYVQSCLWNMDALFIPQDHPARDLQDTFYLSEPAKYPLEPIADLVRAVHEHGGGTGSRGWQYVWDPAEAERVIMRTHTTVNTIRYLVAHPDPPTRVFNIGRNFRRENMDPTHLPEFYQVDGIVQEEGANFRMLIGILKEFYRRMGFSDVRVRPSYFPYTEPSMEIEAQWQGRWLEMGGSGIFRPEVTEPYGVRHPVLAWGLGLERLAMLRYGLEDIRNLYLSDLEWVRSAPIF